MKTRFSNRHSRALTVLGHVKKLAKGLNLGELDVEPYKNGRENGLAIKRWKPDRMVVFSENRNSDDIVVYRGAGREFDWCAGNIPDEVVYVNRATYFQDAEAAARLIVGFLSGPDGKD
jgi:hypothetical protein